LFASLFQILIIRYYYSLPFFIGGSLDWYRIAIVCTLFLCLLLTDNIYSCSDGGAISYYQLFCFLFIFSIILSAFLFSGFSSKDFLYAFITIFLSAFLNDIFPLHIYFYPNVS